MVSIKGNIGKIEDILVFLLRTFSVVLPRGLLTTAPVQLLTSLPEQLMKSFFFVWTKPRVYMCGNNSSSILASLIEASTKRPILAPDYFKSGEIGSKIIFGYNRKPLTKRKATKGRGKGHACVFYERKKIQGKIVCVEMKSLCVCLTQ